MFGEINISCEISAAHCLVNPKDRLYDKSLFSIFLGKGELNTKWSEREGVQYSPVNILKYFQVYLIVRNFQAKELYIFDTYKYLGPEDIGLIKLEFGITYTNVVRPVCIWPWHYSYNGFGEVKY
jgi:hypothetical protein